MFADDTNITFAVSSVADLQNVINLELRHLYRWLITNRLSLNVFKTEFMEVGANQRIHALLNNQINIVIDGKSINQVKFVKKISSAISALKLIRPFISESTALLIYRALVLPHLGCCSSVWDELR